MIKKLLKQLPFVGAFAGSEAWGRIRHRITLLTTDRINAPCTRFFRGPLQYEALLGPVLDFLHAEEKERTLNITVIGCSNGSEPFTISSILRNRRPDLDFTMHAIDINEEMIEMARVAAYPRENVFNHQKITTEFVSSTFDEEDGLFKVKEDISRPVTFEVGDALDTTLKNRIGQSDIVYAQNFLFHLPPELSRKALVNISSLLKPRAALFIDGMDLKIRQSATGPLNLEPLDFKIEEIHNDLRTGAVSTDDTEHTMGSVWPDEYWGLEPFDGNRKNWRRRYATVFLHDRPKTS